MTSRISLGLTVLLSVVVVAGPVAGAETEKRTLDRKFWLLTAATASISVLDVEVSQHNLHLKPPWREVNPIYGSHPSRARMYGTVAGENLLCAYLAYRLKKSPRRGLRRLWWLPQTLTIGEHAGCVVFSVTR